jgi:DNA-binding GntR family transcriptional regulator
MASLKKKHCETLDKGKKQVTKDLLDFTIHELDWHLHHWIVERMKNPFIQEVHRVNMDRIRLFRLNWELDEERFFISMEEHGKIITAFEKRDAASAVDFLEQHLENSLNRSRTLW